MKTHIISIRNLNIYLICINIIAIVVITTIVIIHLNSKEFVVQTIQIKEELNKNEGIDNSLIKENNYVEKEIPTLNIPENLKDKNVIGKLEIEKIGLVTYILGDTSKENLNISVTKLYGPEINKVGNVCIIGHNYRNSKMFGKLKKLEINDVIEVIDLYNRNYKYKVYEINKVNPKDTSCLSQDTKGEREVTLITCTTGALKRLIVKAQEIYD